MNAERRYKYNHVQRADHDLIRHLEERVKKLESLLEKYSQEHPSDVAANFRRRLAALKSRWTVLTMSLDKKPKIGNRYKIIRVEKSDPNFFLVTDKGNKVSGMMYHRDVIERLISEAEQKQK